jgi:hypothetical protein
MGFALLILDLAIGVAMERRDGAFRNVSKRPEMSRKAPKSSEEEKLMSMCWERGELKNGGTAGREDGWMRGER